MSNSYTKIATSMENFEGVLIRITLEKNLEGLKERNKLGAFHTLH